VRKLINSITQMRFLASVCVLCNQKHFDSFPVCDSCQLLLTPLGTACQFCANPLTDERLLICGQCIKEKPFIDKAIIPYQFSDIFRYLLHQFKYQKAIYLSQFFAELMLRELKKTKLDIDCLMPIPMHPARLKERGFNQTVLLTKYLSKKLNIPYDLKACIKHKDTQAQANLNADNRKKNIKDSFSLLKLSHKKIMLIDDLFTTGSTANELAKTLKKAGAEEVILCCLGRTLMK